MADALNPAMDKSILNRTDALMGIGALVIVGMLIIPIPTTLLDIFQAFSIMIGIVTLLAVMYVRKATDFSIFPSLLLIATVYRLALNVSSTRLILLKGTAFDGEIIRAFGNFVVGGNYVIGFIIFLILVAVQFIVITKGATRISEVAARFTLDAMPGKQMSIDAELSNGLITEEEAIRKRMELQKEADFYGAMDGASKFVQGDVKVGIFITLINIVGGIIIGTVMRGESFSTAIKTYTLLTIGDGLVNQIPSLLITTATGIIVKRAIGDENLGKDFAKQLSGQPRALGMSAIALLLSAIIPGFPTLTLIALGLLFGFLAYRLHRQIEETAAQPQKPITEETRKIETGTEYFNIDPIKLEVGYNLIPLVDPEQGGTLLNRITNMRNQITSELGLIVPPIHITDGTEPEVPANRYVILIRGVEVEHFDIEPNKIIVLETPEVTEPLTDAIEFIEPAFETKAYWIDEEQKEEALNKGYNEVPITSMIITHLTEVIKRYAYEIFGRQELQQIIDKVKESNPFLVDDLITTNKISMNELHRILRQLLREGISILDMTTILETIASYVDVTKDIFALTEYVRMALARRISKQFSDENNIIKAITLDINLEAFLRETVSVEPIEGAHFALTIEERSQILSAILNTIHRVKSKGYVPIFVTSSQIRAALFDLISREAKNVYVLSASEIVPPAKIEVIDTVIIRNEERQENKNEEIA